MELVVRSVLLRFVSLRFIPLGPVLLDNISLGTVSLGAVSLGAVSLEAVSLENVSLETVSLETVLLVVLMDSVVNDFVWKLSVTSVEELLSWTSSPGEISFEVVISLMKETGGGMTIRSETLKQFFRVRFLDFDVDLSIGRNDLELL